jgi:hypothetical protein
VADGQRSWQLAEHLLSSCFLAQASVYDPFMKPTRSPKPPPTPAALADREFNHRLRYSLFQSMCEILEVSSAPADLALLRRQRAELEKKLGYETYRAEEAGLSPCGDRSLNHWRKL